MQSSFETCHIFTSGCWDVTLGCVGIRYAFREVVPCQLGALSGGEVGSRAEEVLEVILLFPISAQWEQYPIFPLTLRQYRGLSLACILLLDSTGDTYPSYFCFGWLVALCLCVGGCFVVFVVAFVFSLHIQLLFYEMRNRILFSFIVLNNEKKYLQFGSLLHKISVNLV